MRLAHFFRATKLPLIPTSYGLLFEQAICIFGVVANPLFS
jgi:hypothetical protein